MPDFARAEISTSGADLAVYADFLRSLRVGQVVSLPLEPGETPRRVMRSLNTAAAQGNLRLARLPSDGRTVRFRVLPPQKREVQISEAAERARVEKARATRQARQERAQLQARGMDPDAAGETVRRPRRRRAAGTRSETVSSRTA